MKFSIKKRFLGDLRGEVTFVEFLALMIVVVVPTSIGHVVARAYGVWHGIAVGVVTGFLCITGVVLFYRASGRHCAHLRRELSEKYRWVYRVGALPPYPDKALKPEGAEIRIGDYGWEAEPLYDDGLIYLQGLTAQWRVVWHAGFRPDQIEQVCLKPQSQYDWNYSWATNPPPCPYPVQQRQTPDMGLPRILGRKQTG